MPEFKSGAKIEAELLVGLYTSVGWTTYTRDPAKLALAIDQSLHVVTCWNEEALVGLARVVGDGVTIAYLQDVLVHPVSQRQGIGRELVRRVFEPFKEVRQKVLMTDDEPGQRAFYESLGFTEVRDVKPHPLRSFVRFSG